MSEDDLRVMIVDDSSVMRALLSRLLAEMPGVQLVAQAQEGAAALEVLANTDLDVVLLDLEMPVMDGLQFLEARRARASVVPVVVVSSLAKRGAATTMEALALGAADFLLKPSQSAEHDVAAFAKQLQLLIRVYGRRARRESGSQAAIPGTDGHGGPRPVDAGVQRDQEADLVAIGISTGGPVALRQLVGALVTQPSVPTVIVQHMPEGYTTEFAASLDRVSPANITEATDGQELRAGQVIVAPGGRHLELQRRQEGGPVGVRLTDAPPVSGHRPSIDVLFSSAARQFRGRMAAVIMTGMGRDGVAGIGEVAAAGGVTVAQDESSSVVFGMPRVAIEAGAVGQVMELGQIGEWMDRLAVPAGTAAGTAAGVSATPRSRR